MANGAGDRNDQVPLAGQPDPSAAVIAFVDRITTQRAETTNAQLETVHARLNGMDQATKVLADTVDQVPTNLQFATHELNATMALRFQSVEDHFTLIDKATERQRHDAELSAAALARTQERATTALAVANADALKRSDEHTAEKIKKNEESQLAGQKALADKIEAADQRMNRMEQAISAIQVAAITVRDSRTDTRSTQNLGLYVLSVVLALVVTAATIYGIVKP